MLLFFMIVVQAVLVFYYGFDEDSLTSQIDFKLKKWISDKQSSHLDSIQSFVRTSVHSL